MFCCLGIVVSYKAIKLELLPKRKLSNEAEYHVLTRKWPAIVQKHLLTQYSYGEARVFDSECGVLIVEKAEVVISEYLCQLGDHAVLTEYLFWNLFRLFESHVTMFLEALGQGVFIGDAHCANVGAVLNIPDDRLQSKEQRLVVVDAEQVIDLTEQNVQDKDIILHGDTIINDWMGRSLQFLHTSWIPFQRVLGDHFSEFLSKNYHKCSWSTLLDQFQDRVRGVTLELASKPKPKARPRPKKITSTDSAVKTSSISRTSPSDLTAHGSIIVNDQGEIKRNMDY